jgi:MFS family permease
VSGLRQQLGESLVAFREVAANAGLRRLQLAYTGSETGSWISVIALSILVFRESGTTSLGLVLFLQTVVPGIVAPFTGVLGDRFPRLRVMIGADLIRVALCAVIAVAAFADAPLAVFYVLVPLVGVVSTAFRPAQAAILPSLARSPNELTAANVVSSTIESATSFVGPALGGVIVGVFDEGVGFAVAAATYLWSALLLARIAPPTAEGTGAEDAGSGAPEAQVAPAGFVREVLAGAQAVRRDTRLFLLVALMGAQVLVAAALFVLTVPLAFDLLDVGEEGFGTLTGASGIGGLIGAVVAIGLVGRRLSRAFGLGVILWGAPIALLPVWDSFAGALVLIGVVGFANTLVDVPGFTLLQRVAPEDVLARVFGILEGVLYGATALGALLAPALVAGLGLEWALVATGLFLPVLVGLTWRPIARIDADSPAPVERLGLLRAVPFLAPLAPTVLESLAEHASDVRVPAGQAVFRQGEGGDRFYVIRSGEAAVEVDGEARASLPAGGFFGEIALLRDVPRTATVTAETYLELLALERDEFIAAVTGHAPSAEAAGAVVAARLGASGPAFRLTA